MPASDSPAIIVARFLKANNYDLTLDAFLEEAGLPPDAGTIERGDLTLEKILEEKKVFDLSERFERVGIQENRGWSLPAPSQPVLVSTLPTATNLLHVSIESLDHEASPTASQLLLATTADRCLHLLVPNSTFTLIKSVSHIQDSPILSFVPFGTKHLITTSMSGQVILFDTKDDKVLDERRDHKKYAVQVAVWDEVCANWVATAGWDAKIFLYRINRDHRLDLGPPIAYIALDTNPESVTFIEHPASKRPVLLVTRRDSTSLHYYSLPSIDEPSTTKPAELELLGSQNLAPHSNAWIAFSPSSVAVCPTDSSLLAVATSAVPHMKLIVVRLLVPLPFSLRSGAVIEPATQAAQTRANIAIQDKEDAAIQVHVSTLAPQTPYSTPQVVWRPDGSGVWVNGDDGVLRGLEATTGKIVTTLKDGHEMGSKIRSIWCGIVDVGGEEQEWVVSGGFDRRLVVWKPSTEQ